MTNYQFKSNINCDGCIQKVTPVLAGLKGVEKWMVDTTDPQKLLQVQGEPGMEAKIIEALLAIGYKAEPLPQVS